MPPLVLKRASVSRPSGQWRDEDYDVLENGVVVGPHFQSAGRAADRPWMWAAGHNGDIHRAAYGYEPTRDARWRRSLGARASFGAIERH